MNRITNRTLWISGCILAITFIGFIVATLRPGVSVAGSSGYVYMHIQPSQLYIVVKR